MSSKIALLIDAENISYKDLPRILEKVSRHGEIVLQAVYGDWERPDLQKWHEITAENKFKIRHQSNPSKTKNSSDMKLIMDAMEILYRVAVDIFCLVTNDADYVPLCDKIHESKKEVIGIGYKHASEAFIRACDDFIFIGRGEAPIQSIIPAAVEVSVSLPKQPTAPKPPNPPKQPAPQKPPNPPAIRKLLSKAFAKAPQEANGWLALTALGQMLRQVQTDFSTTAYGHANLSKLLQSIPDFVEVSANSARLRIDSAPKQPVLNELETLISQAFAKAPKDTNRWVGLPALGSAIRQVQAGFLSTHYGHATLSKLLKSMPDFVEIKTNGTDKSARLKK